MVLHTAKIYFIEKTVLIAKNLQTKRASFSFCLDSNPYEV